MSIFDIFKRKANQQLLGLMSYDGSRGVVYPDFSLATAASIYKRNSQVYSVLQLIMKAFIKAKPILYNNEGDEVLEHPILDLLNKPNPAQSGTAFRENYIIDKCIFGNSFILGMSPENGNNAGKPVQLWLLPPGFIKIVVNTYLGEINRYEWTAFQINKQYKPDQVCHIKNYNPEFSVDGHYLIGVSPLVVAGKATAMSDSGFDANVFSFQNMGAAGMISGEGDGYTPEQAERIQQKYKEKWSGKTKAGEMMVVSGKANFVRFGMSPVDLNILESLKFSIRQLCAVWNVPSELVNDSENKNYNSFKEARKALLTQCVFPELDKFYDELGTWLFAKFGLKGHTLGYDKNIYDELQSDLFLLTQQLAVAWWLTGNEKRAAMGYGELDDPVLDEVTAPVDMMPIEPVKAGDYLSRNNIQL